MDHTCTTYELHMYHIGTARVTANPEKHCFPWPHLWSCGDDDSDGLFEAPLPSPHRRSGGDQSIACATKESACPRHHQEREREGAARGSLCDNGAAWGKVRSEWGGGVRVVVHLDGGPPLRESAP